MFVGVRHGDVKEWNFCWNKYNQSRVPSERKLLLKVLGASNDPWLLQRYLIFILILYYAMIIRLIIFIKLY